MSETSKKILFEDFYKSEIVDPIADSGDVDFEVVSPPVNKKGWIIINPQSSTLRERMFYSDVVGNRIYVKGVNRYSPKVHDAGESVQINDTALIFNHLSEIASTTFYVEKISGLQVNIWGGPILMDNQTKSVTDTVLTLNNNATNYIYYTSTDNIIRLTPSETTAQSGIITAEITTAGGIVTEILYRNYKVNIMTINSNDIQDLGGTIVTDDVAETITITYADGTSTIYKTDGIYYYDDEGSLTAKTEKTGTYSNGTMTYEDGTAVNGDEGTVTTIPSSIAYKDKVNTFTETNIFTGDVVFKGNVTFPYGTATDDGSTITFNTTEGTKQKVGLTTAGARVLSFENLVSGANYELAIVNNTGGDVDLSMGTMTNPDTTITNFYSIGGTSYPLTLATGVHLFVMDTFDTAIHIAYAGKSTQIN